jgi:intracellular sulfur oxidation DsrE/DsrF family protein
MKQIVIMFVAIIAAAAILSGCASGLHGTAEKDNIAREKAMKDSLKMAKLFAIAQYPYVKGSKWSGIIPVDNPTEIPDPAHDYKLLFELTAKNPDSLAKDINVGLDEVARVLNLHFASGIPANKIVPVIVIHGPGLEAIGTNEFYKKKHSMDNPNLKLIQDLEKAGAKFIACGQAMAFFDYKKDDLLPDVKISLTAQTVLSNYQYQGYVLYSIKE